MIIEISTRARNHLIAAILLGTYTLGAKEAGGRKRRWILLGGPPEKQSQSNLRWMRLISPNNNRRETVLLSRRAQTMAIHANPWPEPLVLPMRKSMSLSHSHSPSLRCIHRLFPPRSISTSASTFDSSASAVGAQWCQTIDPYLKRRVRGLNSVLGLPSVKGKCHSPGVP